MEENETKKFRVELLIYNNIFSENEEIQMNKGNKKNLFIDKEIIDLEIPIKHNTESYIKVFDLRKLLRKKGYPIMKDSKLYIQLKYSNDYIIIDDQKENIIYLSSLSSDNNIIKLKLENNIDSRLIDDFPFCQKKLKKKSKRKSLIKDIITQLYVQRMLHKGYYDEFGEKKSHILTEASDMIDRKKKTMDDYMTQIRIAYINNNFNFNDNKNKEINYLRDFVKKNNNKKNNEIKNDIKDNKESDILNLNEDDDNY